MTVIEMRAAISEAEGKIARILAGLSDVTGLRLTAVDVDLMRSSDGTPYVRGVHIEMRV